MQNPNRDRLNKMKEYVDNPKNVTDIYEYISSTTNKKDQRILLSLSQNIFIANFILYTLFLSAFYPFIPYLNSQRKQQQCEKQDIVNDIPLFAYYLVSSIIEYLLVRNIAYIIGSERIYNATSLLTIVQMYNSVTARYDVYTDIVFALKLAFCEDESFQVLAILSLIIISVNFIFSVKNTITILLQIRKQNIMNQGNTSLINEYTKLAFVQDYYAIAVILDRFSTSSASELPIKALKGIKIPQVILSKFQRVFLENIPQIIILAIYHYKKIDQLGDNSAFYQWDNLVVLITTLMSLQSALSYAWHAKPSSFRSYQFKIFQQFQQTVIDQYYMLVTHKNEEKRFQLDKFLSILNQAYQDIQKSSKDDTKKDKRENQFDRNNEEGIQSNSLLVGFDDNKSNKSYGYKSVNESHMSLESYTSKISKTSSNSKATKKKKEIKFEEKQVQLNFQQNLIKLCFDAD